MLAYGTPYLKSSLVLLAMVAAVNIVQQGLPMSPAAWLTIDLVAVAAFLHIRVWSLAVIFSARAMLHAYQADNPIDWLLYHELSNVVFILALVILYSWTGSHRWRLLRG